MRISPRIGLIIAAFVILWTRYSTAQNFTTLHNFAKSDGADPYSGLVYSAGTLYGTASGGGNPGSYNGDGLLFAVGTNGAAFSNLYAFTSISSPYYTNSDGVVPDAGVILSGSTLYGATYGGGTVGVGTVFAFNMSSNVLVPLHEFSAAGDGGGPDAGLILSGSTLYGTTAYGGDANYGVVFSMLTNGVGFTTLHSFTNGTDGDGPGGVLLLSSNRLYGTTSGGNSGNSSVFAMDTNGSNFTSLHAFTATSGFPNYTNADGSAPDAGLVLSGHTLYGTASAGGKYGSGVVFEIDTSGSNFTVLYTFTNGTDGANPRGGVVLSGNTLYGTTYNGSLGSGTIFAVNTDGSGFTNLHVFSAAGVYPYTNSDGAHPEGGLILVGNTLYGTATTGGNPPPPPTITGQGTIFALTLPSGTSPPQLTIHVVGTNAILTWPTNAPGFTLQASTNLPSAVWTNISGQFLVTNPITGTGKFYRLKQ